MAILIKTEEQIEGIRKSSHLAADTLDWVEQFVVPGVTTNQLNDHIEKFIRDHGAIPAPLGYKGFPKACCTSLNEVICHGIPSEQVLKEGDIVNIDVTTILNGYYGDTCRMFPVGQISDEARKIMSVAKDCLDMAIVAVKPDMPFWTIGKAITTYAQSRGCSVVYQFVGHGVGLAFHEDPHISHYWHPDMNKDERLMKPGMIFTIEPMINLGVAEAVVDSVDKWTARTADGKLSAQYEHTVLVCDYGVEVLTTS